MIFTTVSRVRSESTSSSLLALVAGACRSMMRRLVGHAQLPALLIEMKTVSGALM
jgi:hypothetical protein